jgi:hypothetical protein
VPFPRPTSACRSKPTICSALRRFFIREPFPAPVEARGFSHKTWLRIWGGGHPRTLSALIAKQDVEIPLVAKLGFITEPDGGPTEDFMIPDWLAEREKLRGADRTRALQPDRR